MKSNCKDLFLVYTIVALLLPLALQNQSMYVLHMNLTNSELEFESSLSAVKWTSSYWLNCVHGLTESLSELQLLTYRCRDEVVCWPRSWKGIHCNTRRAVVNCTTVFTRRKLGSTNETRWRNTTMRCFIATSSWVMLIKSRNKKVRRTEKVWLYLLYSAHPGLFHFTFADPGCT